MNHRFAPFALAAFGLLTACAPDPTTFPAVRDLAAELPFAEASANVNPKEPDAAPPRPPVPPDPARANRRGDGLAIAPETSLDFFLALDGPSVLTFGGLGDRQGAPKLTVTVLFEGEQEREKTLAAFTPGDGARTVNLEGEGRRLARIRFRTGSGTAPALVIRPTLRSRPSPETAVASPSQQTPSGGRPTDRPTDVVIYLIDTLRADHVGLYRRPEDRQEPSLTPRIDAFGAAATVFTDAVSVSSWTRPTTASILTGLTPLDHGATRLETRLDPEVTTLAERLRDAGLRTAAWSANAHVTTATGFGQGFETLHFDGELPRGGELVRSALSWFDGLKTDESAFVYLHTIDPHAPYDPPSELRQRFAPEAAPGAGSRDALVAAYRDLAHRKSPVPPVLERLYDAEVAAADGYFGELLDGLAARGRLDSALIVLLADHGEEFGEHGALGHGKTLYGEVTDIPLVIKLPSQTTGQRLDFRAQQIDLVPTILSALGLDTPAALAGIDLFAPRGVGDRPAFAHLDYEGRLGLSVSLGRHKWIEPWSRKFSRRARLFDREVDPSEMTDRLDLEPVRAGYLRALGRATALAPRQVRKPGRAQPTAEEIRALEALGYL